MFDLLGDKLLQYTVYCKSSWLKPSSEAAPPALPPLPAWRSQRCPPSVSASRRDAGRLKFDRPDLNLLVAANSAANCNPIYAMYQI